jgi:hypothetical protein
VLRKALGSAGVSSGVILRADVPMQSDKFKLVFLFFFLPTVFQDGSLIFFYYINKLAQSCAVR